MFSSTVQCGLRLLVLLNKVCFLQHYAVAAPTAKRKAMVDILVRKGGDVNLGNRDGITALHIAAEKSHLDVLEMLLKIGAQV